MLGWCRAVSLDYTWYESMVGVPDGVVGEFRRINVKMAGSSLNEGLLVLVGSRTFGAKF